LPFRRAAPIAALCLVTLGFWAAQWRPFLLPNNDYYSFERAAKSFASGALPRETKRMPAFPAAMAVVARAMPEPHPELHAALALNAAFALGSLLLLHRLASRTLGPRAAILPPALWAASVQFHAMGLQPLVEPSLGFFVLLAFVLYAARSPWQYAAAFAVGLGRFEAASVIPILAAANAWFDGHVRRHVALGALAASGFVGWTLLGLAAGSGGSFYLELMEGMGFEPAPGFFLRQLQEAFAIPYASKPFVLLPALTAVGVPLGWGALCAWREQRRLAAPLLLYLCVCTSVIAVFGVNKARYVHPSVWVLVLFFSLGLVRLRERAFERLAPRVSAGAARALAAGGAALFLAATAAALLYLRGTPGIVPIGIDLAFGAACLALAALALRPGPRPPRALGFALGCAVLALVATLVLVGTARRRMELRGIHDANYATVVLADWLRAHLTPDERIVVLSRSHLLHLGALEPRQVTSFEKTEASDTEELAAWMRQHGFSHVAYTYRKPVHNPAAGYYHRTLRAFVADPFRDGGEVPGFEHVATLRLPAEVQESDVQVYRLRR
jgi:hypothetical protein